MSKFKVLNLHNNIPVHCQPRHRDVLEKIIALTERKIPSGLCSFVELILVGEFPEMVPHGFVSLYEDGAIYLESGGLNSEESSLSPEELEEWAETIIHEIAHSLEMNSAEFIYGDGDLVSEFLGKRSRLFDLLKSHGEIYEPRGRKIWSQELMTVKDHFENVDYQTDFDDFLTNKISYELIDALAPGLFPRPYSAVSIREYFATGFEDFFNGREYVHLKRNCPILFSKIEELAENAKGR